MKKDIPQLKVTDLAIAIVPVENDPGIWESFLVNTKDQAVTNVLINSRGYGELNGDKKETTLLRYFFEEVGPNQAVLIEPIQEELFDLTNEFWISFSFEGHMYDKKYIFVRGSIDSEYFIEIPFLNRRGVMIR